MAALPADTKVPWQRVLNRCGEISPRNSDGGVQRQRLLLEAEEIRFGVRGRVDWASFGWDFPAP